MIDFPVMTAGVGKLAPGVGNLGVHQRQIDPPGPDQVVLEVIACGICGTDLHIADDEFPSEPPVTMGHEVTGEVAAVGEGVAPAWLGARVACETYFSYCGRCGYCRNGEPNLCSDRRSIGSREDGGFSRWMTIPAQNLWRLPESVGRHAGALAEPLACVARCFFDPAIVNVGDRVLIVGPGTMGLLTAQCARAAGGVVTVAGLARDEHRLAVATALGMQTMIVDEGALVSGGFDVVAEASGTAAGVATALAAVARRGRYVQVGIFGKPVPVPLDTILYSELIVTSGNASTPRSWQRAMQLLETGAIQLDPLISHTLPLQDWQEGFDITRRGTGIKVVLDPQRGSP
jgi:L-iditol 2-dehydrogenase